MASRMRVLRLHGGNPVAEDHLGRPSCWTAVSSRNQRIALGRWRVFGSRCGQLGEMQSSSHFHGNGSEQKKKK